MKKRIISLMLVLAMCLSLLPMAAVATDGAGADEALAPAAQEALASTRSAAGTAEDPILIGSAEELSAFAYRVNERHERELCAQLTADITLGDTYTSIANGPAYIGTFDGNGHTIYAKYGVSNLFGRIGNTGKVQDLTVEIDTMTAVSGSGVITKENHGTIERCSVRVYGSLTLSSGSFGLIAHSNSTSGTIEHCRGEVSKFSASGSAKAAGIAYANTGTIRNCYFDGRFRYDDTNGAQDFAIVSTSYSGTVENCYCLNDVLYQNKNYYQDETLSGVHGAARNPDSRYNYQYTLGDGQVTWLLNNGSGASTNETDPWRLDEYGRPTLDPAGARVTKTGDTYTVETLHAHRAGGRLHEFEALTSTPTGSGYYYLDADTTLSGAWKITGETVLCLNDNTLTTGGNAIEIAAGGTLTLMLHDKKTGGTVTGVGTIVTLSGGTLIMQGGTITGGAKGVELPDGSTFRMEGGEITGCATGVSVYGSGLTLSGSAKVTGNSDQNILLLDGSVLSFGELNADAKFGITLHDQDGLSADARVAVTDQTGGQYHGQLVADAFAGSGEWGFDLYLSEDGKTVLFGRQTEHIHCLCGANYTNAGHTAHTRAGFLPWQETTSLPQTGSYYLTRNVTLTSSATLIDANICLNGYTVTLSGSGTRIYAGSNGSRDAAGALTDCTGKGTVMGGGVFIWYGSTFSLYSGTLDGTKTEIGQTGGTFNLYGGKITNNTAASAVAGQNFNGIHINIYGGEISGNHTSADCGGVWVGAGNTFKMYGGTIRDNIGTSAGGVGFTTGNTTYPNGTMSVSGSTVIQGNTADGGISNVCLPAGMTITIDGGLSAGAQIGVSAASVPSGAITGANSADMSSFFTSDDPNYEPADTEGTHEVRLNALPILALSQTESLTQPYGTATGKLRATPNRTNGYTFTYQWYLADDEAGTSTAISGATDAEYTIPRDTPVGEYKYYCEAVATPVGGGQTQRLTCSSGGAVTITKAKQDSVYVSLPVYFNTETMYTRELVRDLPTLGEGLTFGNVSYALTYEWRDEDWIRDTVQLNNGVLAFESKANNDPEADIVLKLDVTVTSDNYENFVIEVTGRVTPKLEHELAAGDVRWTYGDAPIDPKEKVSGVPTDAAWVRTTYTSRDGKTNYGSTPPTDAGEYKFKVEYESVSTHHYAEGNLTIEPIIVSKNQVQITNIPTTYNGTAKNARDFIRVTVTANGKTYGPLVADKDFWVSGAQAAADVSQTGHRSVLTLKGNYRIAGDEQVVFEWFIDPLEAELELTNADNRRYGDGKGAVTMQVKNAYERDGLTLTYDGGTDLGVGDHDVTALTLSGAGAGNYTLPAAKTLRYHVAKGDAGDPRHLTMDVYNNTARTYIYDFTKALPELGEGLTLGNYSYSGTLSGYESEYWINESNVHFQADTGVLTFTTGKRTSSSDNFILCYVVTVQSDNYNNFQLILSAYPKDKDEVPLPEGTVSITSWSYGSEPNDPEVKTPPAGAQLVSTVYTNAADEVITPSSTMDAGSYTVTLRYETDDTAYIGSADFTVHPRHVTWENFVVPDGVTLGKIYDGTTDSALTELSIERDMLVTTADAALRVGGTAKYASPNAGQTSLLFTPDLTIRLSDPSSSAKPSNYEVTSSRAAEFSATIQKRLLGFTVDSVSKRYGSPDSTADVRVTFTGVTGNDQSGLVSGEQLEQGVDYDVRADFTRTDIGEDQSVVVTVALKDTEKARNYELVTKRINTTGTITKAAAPVIPEQTVEIYSNAVTQYPIDLTKGWPAGTPSISDYTYGGKHDPDLNVEEMSKQLYQSASYMLPAARDWKGTMYLSINRAFSADVGTDLGVLKVIFKSTNYEDLTLRIRFKIKAKAQETLSVSLDGWTYGEPANPPAYTVPAAEAETTLTYTSRDGQTSYGATPPTDAGDYTLTIRCEGIDTIWTGSADFTIAPAKLTVTALDKEIIAGEDAPDLTNPVEGEDYTVEGLLGADALDSVTLTYSETPDTSKAGTYTINIAATLKNYDVTTVPGTLTIHPAPPKRQPMGISAPGSTPGGTIEISPKNAPPGQTVTIITTPDKGYELGGLTVKDIDGETIDLVDEGDGEFTFTMPKSSIKISGFFVREGESLFRDVPADSYYYEAVRWAKQNGITSGVSKDLFGSTLPCTRAQIVTFLWRAAGSPEPQSEAKFADVPASAYYAKAVAWAVEEGITNGVGDNKFDPDAPCTRAQCVTFLYRAAGSPKVSDTADFEDVAETAYYAKAVAWAQKQDITAGVSATRFAPQKDCTRAQIVTFLYRAFAE